MSLFSSPFSLRRITPLLSHALFLDTETAGLNPDLNGILSVGAVTLDGKEFYGECRKYAQQQIEPAALKVNGFAKEEIIDKDMEKDSAHEMVRKLVEWAKGVLPPAPVADPGKLPPPIGYIVGQNPRFDYDMLQSPWYWKFTKEGGGPFPLAHRQIDLHSLACVAFLKEGREIPSTGIGSKEIPDYLGLSPEPVPHRALEGAKYHRAMFLALLSKL